MTKPQAEKRRDQLRRNAERTGLTYEAEQERPGTLCRKWVVRSYRNDRWTGSTYYV